MPISPPIFPAKAKNSIHSTNDKLARYMGRCTLWVDGVGLPLPSDSNFEYTVERLYKNIYLF